MVQMFAGCESFNQDISNWNVSNVKQTIGIFEDCPIEEKNKPKFKK
jgi:surface protein